MEQVNISHDVSGRFLATAREIYDSLDFESNTNPNNWWLETLFVRRPPGILPNIIIGAIFSFAGFILWILRIKAVKDQLEKNGVKLTTNDSLRIIISATIDNDSNVYTIVSYSGLSFLFLAGIQWNFRATLCVMMIFYIVASAGDSLRILLAYSSFKTLEEVTAVSQKGGLSKKVLKNTELLATLKPGNVYEDISRGATIVFMVFALQVILTSFVCYDLLKNDRTKCFDGTSGCPIGGTLGSWILYVLGIFMASVYMLGPNSHFGQSEQNPAYWLRLLLATKGDNVELSWTPDPGSKSTGKIDISSGREMYVIWFRFFQSYLINGVAYHILVHALPIQVAYQSSLTSVVFRAVGMMYLVDLDDTPGPALSIHQKKETEGGTNAKETPVEEPTTGNFNPNQDIAHLSEAAQEILNEARLKLEMLGKGQLPDAVEDTDNFHNGALIAHKRDDADGAVDSKA